MKKIWIIVGIVVAVALAISIIVIQTKKGPEEIKIGAILPLTGNVGIFGEWIKNGMNLALEKIEKNEPELEGTIKIIYEDSQNDAKMGISALNKFLSIDKIDIVVSAMSKVSIPLIPITEEKKIPLFMQDVTYPEITKKGEMVFRHFIQSDREASILAEYAINHLDVRTVGILYVNDEAGLGAKESFSKVITMLYGRVLNIESYEVTDTDMKSQIIKVISAKPDGIYLFGNGPSWAVTLKQIKEIGYRGVILTNTAMYIPNFRQIAGKESIEGVYFTYPYMDTTEKSVQEFVNLYKEKFGEDPPIESAYAWDIIQIIAKAQKERGDNLFEKLLNVKILEGAFGILQIHEDRDIKTAVGIGIIKNGEIMPISVRK